MLSSKPFSRCLLPLAASVLFLCGDQVFAQDKLSVVQIEELRQRANLGDADAQYQAGMFVLSGRDLNIKQTLIEAEKRRKDSSGSGGMRLRFPDQEEWEKTSEQRDYDKYLAAYDIEEKKSIASEWFRKAADQGHPAAQFQMGIYYSEGCDLAKDVLGGFPEFNFKKDPTVAVGWYRKAASQGNLNAQYELGRCYLTGEGVPKNDDEHFKWVYKAAEHGHAKAQEMLGICYAKGEGVALDNVKAYMWFNLSIAAGNLEAAKRRDRMTERMTPKQIAESQKLSSEWKPAP